ncbi:MAG: outer membrane beta-barrel protein [bacterium]
MRRIIRVFSAAVPVARTAALGLLLATGLSGLSWGSESWHVATGAGVLLFPGGEASRDNMVGTLRLGYDLNAPLSIELGGLAGGFNSPDRGADGGWHSIRGTWADLIVHLARWERLDPYLSAGVGAFWCDGHALPDNRQEGFAPRLGAGILYSLSEHWSVRAGVTAMTLQPNERQACFGFAEAALCYYFGDTTPERPGMGN